MTIIPKAPFATIDDVLVVRNADGDVTPIEVRSPLLGRTVSFFPILYGYVKAHSLLMDIPAVKWELEQKLALVADHYIHPDFNGITSKDIESKMDPITLDHLVMLVVAHSIPTFRLRVGDSEAPGMAEAVLKEILSRAGSAPSNMSSTSSDIGTPVKETSIS